MIGECLQHPRLPVLMLLDSNGSEVEWLLLCCTSLRNRLASKDVHAVFSTTSRRIIEEGIDDDNHGMPETN